MYKPLLKNTFWFVCVCAQLRHMEHHDGNIYIKYAMGHKTSKFVFCVYFLSSLQAVMKIN